VLANRELGSQNFVRVVDLVFLYSRLINIISRLILGYSRLESDLAVSFSSSVFSLDWIRISFLSEAVLIGLLKFGLDYDHSSCLYKPLGPLKASQKLKRNLDFHH